MLASLLPGLREIRAPLAAGYLWLVAGWVAFHDNVARQAEHSHGLAALSALKDDVGTGAFAAAITFVAYLLGSLWEPVAFWFAGAVWTLMRARRPDSPLFGDEDEPPLEREGFLPRVLHRVRRGSPTGIRAFLRQAKRAREKGRSSQAPPRSPRVSGAAWARLWATAERLFEDIDERVRPRLGVGERDEAVAFQEFRTFQHLVQQAVNRLPEFVSNPQAPPSPIRRLEQRFARSTIRRAELYFARYRMHDAFLDDDDRIDGTTRAMYEKELGTARDRSWGREARDMVRDIPVPGLELVADDLRHSWLRRRREDLRSSFWSALTSCDG
jgi:hypothetical protein